MKDLRKLAEQLKQLENQLIVCMRCGMCQSACPLFEETGRETDVARGKLALLDGLAGRMLDDPEAVRERIFRCLLCGSCAAACPSGVKAPDIFIRARAILSEYIGLSPVKKLIFRKLLADPDVFDTAAEWASRFQDLFIKPATGHSGASRARIGSPLLNGRRFQHLARLPFHQEHADLEIAPGGAGLRVFMFSGCLIDKIFPQVAAASVQALVANGVGVGIPSNQACCGIPALASGDSKGFSQLVKHNLSLFDPDRFDYLLTACATCASTIVEHWPKASPLTGSKELNRLIRISEKTMDISQFLAAIPGIGGPAGDHQSGAVRVTYHDPCHLKKTLNVFSEPRALIRANPRYQLVEMDGADKCCGMGGSFNIDYYPISKAIGKRKRNAIVHTDCRIVATGCPACMIQISDMLAQSNDRISVKHPVEIYTENFKQDRGLLLSSAST